MRDAGDPVELSLAYENQGADELVLLDVSATPEGRGSALHTVAAVRAKLGIPMTVGGGVRRTEDAGALLEAGADKVGANTAAVERPELLTEIATRFGSQCAVVSIDATRQGDGGWEVVTKSGKERTGKDAIAWAREATERGAGEILLTSWIETAHARLRHRTAACRLGRRPRAGHCLGRSRPSRSSGRGDQSRRKCGTRSLDLPRRRLHRRRHQTRHGRRRHTDPRRSGLTSRNLFYCRLFTNVNWPISLVGAIPAERNSAMS